MTPWRQTRFAVGELRLRVARHAACSLPPTTPRRGGFTLIELVLALSMVAILSVSLFTSVRIAFRAQASAQASIEPVRTAGLAMDALRQDFENALPQGDNLAGAFTGTTTIDPAGNPSENVILYTTAASPEHDSANGEIKRVELTVIRAADLTSQPPQTSSQDSDLVLVRRVVRNLLTSFEVTPDEQVICRGVTAFSVRYFDGTQWLDDVDGAQLNALPVAVEVTLELQRPLASGGDVGGTVRSTAVFRLACSTLSSSGLSGGQP